jgi:hypothetical protein
MIRAVLALAALASAATANAQPIKLKCRILGRMEKIHGLLSVTVDPEARRVEVTAERVPDVQWMYQDGVLAPIQIIGPDYSPWASMPLPQFVRIDARMVSFGYRNDDDPSGGAVSSFNRSALDAPAVPCLWHSMREFAAG